MGAVPNREGLMQATLGVVGQKELDDCAPGIEERRFHSMNPIDQPIAMLRAVAAERAIVSCA
jgi:hypothetical protein